MSRFFIYIYDWFGHHKAAFYSILVCSAAIFSIMASQINFQEDITNFFSGSDEKKNATFGNVAVKDKIIVMLSGENPDSIMAAAEIFEERLGPLLDSGLINSVTSHADEEAVERSISFIYEYLPIFLKEEDYQALQEKISGHGVAEAVGRVYDLLTSPSGMVIGDVLMQDPLNIGTHLLEEFGRFSPDMKYEIYDGRIFTEDMGTMLMFIQPSNGMGDTGSNDALVTGLESAVSEAETACVQIDCLGGPIVAVYNARQIKRDTGITLSAALALILLVIFLSFRNKWSIPLIVTPPLYGAIFALAMVWVVQGEISAIAIGAGTVVLGISLSYSIHIISHLNNISSPKEIIRELTVPLTVGCFTTIGAFAALTFTSSSLLRDMGLFSVFTLIGTTVFSLVFLPQFLRGFDFVHKSPVLRSIERITGYRYEGNIYVVMAITAVAVIALFFYGNVGFDDDMSNINYLPEHIADAEAHAAEILGDESSDVYIVTGNNDADSLSLEYARLCGLLEREAEAGSIADVVTMDVFLVAPSEQMERIGRWNSFWEKHRGPVLSQMREAAADYGFRNNAFCRFEEMISREYHICSYTEDQTGDVPVISEWARASDGYVSVMARISVSEENKAAVYGEIDALPNTAIIDRGYFSSKMVESTGQDFNYILLVSSLIVFLALFLSYGRLELTLLTFLPMAVSWVIILGMMAILDIRFNIVNIILATFIFGIGDDFSIFIMDGLIQEYRNGRKLLDAHKTAIFFSAFTAIVGMGALIFARHPALKSIALVSVLGLSVVVLVSYTVQPMLFRLLVTSQTRKGGFPYTLGSILNSLYCFLYFLLGCILSQLYMLILMPLPVSRQAKKRSFHKMLYLFTGIFLKTMLTVRTVRKNPSGEDYSSPAVIIANHQSFIDILLLLSTTPDIVMVTNSWVWNSPFFGRIVRYAGFYHSADGYEALAGQLRERVAEGYSVVVFPEGTRSADGSIKRFHKGAFYLAGRLKLDILPMVIYGTGQVSNKRQGFHINHGIVAVKTMPRVRYGDMSFGETYQEQAKNLREWYIAQYKLLNNELGRAWNPYFRNALISNYIYKGPVLEWYMRLKCRIDGYYDLWDRLIPRDALVTDVGCGYGQMSFMLGILSPDRKILGIDYDGDKIELASNSLLCGKADVSFRCADMLSMEFPESDAILFNDSLHYVCEDGQRQILSRAAGSLTPRGMIVVRDGDMSRSEVHGRTKRTEVWSTRIFRFNKTRTSGLSFVTAGWMAQFAADNMMDIRIHQCDSGSSETLYILKRRLPSAEEME